MTTKTDRVLLVSSGPETGIRVRPASGNGSAGIELVEVSEDERLGIALQDGEFDLVVTEEELGWSIGHDVLRRVKGVRPEVPVILLREEADVSAAVEAVRAGFEDVVSIDADGLARLGDAIRTALDRTRDHLHATRRTSSLEGTLQRLQVGFFRLSAEGEILKANRTCLDLLGLRTPADARRYALHEHFFHREDAERVEAGLKRDGRVPLTEVLVRRADGAVGRVCLSESAGTTSIGEAIVDGIMLEPSTHAVDHVPMAAAARVHVTLHSIPLLLAILDRFGHIVWIQGRDLGALGIDREDCVGKMLTTLGRTSGNVMDDVARALAGEQVSDTLRIDDRVFRVRMSLLRGSRSIAPEVAMVAMEAVNGVSGREALTRVFTTATAPSPGPTRVLQPVRAAAPTPPVNLPAVPPQPEREEIAI